MLEGLELLNTDERCEILRLIGLPEQDIDSEIAPTAVLTWMGEVLGLKKISDPEALERAVLGTVAKHWDVEFEADIDTNDLERLLRRKMAAEATVFLAPCWRLACALLAAEASAVDQSKLDMLEKAAQLVVPSSSVLGEHRQEWERLVYQWQHENPIPNLKEELDALAQNTGVARHSLRLGLVIALADGRLSADEERLCKELAVLMGVPEADATTFTLELNSLFWKHRNTMNEAVDDPHETAVIAARQAMLESGALEGLVNEARDNLLVEPESAPSGWSRLMGALSGLSQFFSARIDDESKANLSRIVYLSIMKQRQRVMHEKRQAEEAAQQQQLRQQRALAAQRPPEEAAPLPPAPALNESSIPKFEPKRSISLE